MIPYEITLPVVHFFPPTVFIEFISFPLFMVLLRHPHILHFFMIFSFPYIVILNERHNLARNSYTH